MKVLSLIFVIMVAGCALARHPHLRSGATRTPLDDYMDNGDKECVRFRSNTVYRASFLIKGWYKSVSGTFFVCVGWLGLLTRVLRVCMCAW
jgi:hypothetical protein